MARINLLTIHYGKSYGAVMQTFATCRLLEEAGHTVTVINLINPSQKGNWKSVQYWKDIVREFQFYLFKRHYFSKLTNKAYTIDDICLPEADVTIVGSDQVWNRDITGCFGNSFFLDFAHNTRKVALSSSFGKETWKEDHEYTEVVKHYLELFSAISVREASGVEILKNAMGLDAINLPDPTIGYGKFETIVKSHKPLHNIYPFLLLDNADTRNKANHIAISLNTPLFEHTVISGRLLNGPRQWLSRIRNSDYIITDSFHGLALSIIFNKQFFVFCASEEKFTRLRSLLRLLSLEDRYVDSIEDFENRKDILLKPIDYSTVNDTIRKEQERYRTFIQNSI